MADTPSNSATLPIAPSGGGKTVGNLPSPDDIFESFNTPDEGETEEPEVIPQKTKDKTKSKETDDEEPEVKEDEDEIELKEPDEDEEKLELEKDDDEIRIDTPPRKREILKEYPEIFKKFPWFEKMMFRDKQYNELFGSFDDAKELADKADIFNQFEQQLLNGNTESILRDLKDTDTKAFDKVVDSYLVTLHKVDKDAYFNVVDQINKRLIQEMVKVSNESQNDDLKQAALLVNQFLYGTSKFTPHENRVKEDSNTEKNEAEKERLDFIQERFETSRDDLQTRVDNTLRATINEYIDPRGSMNGYMKKNAINDALKMVHEAIGNDRSSTSTLNKLWRAAFDAKFSKDSLQRIQSFYLGKAKPVLSPAIKKARAEALKDLAPRARKTNDDEEKEETPRTRRIATGRPSSQTKEDKGGMRKGESVADFFARD